MIWSPSIPRRRVDGCRDKRYGLIHADNNAKCLPTPEEIAVMAAAIRDGWDEGTRRRRRRLITKRIQGDSHEQ